MSKGGEIGSYPEREKKNIWEAKRHVYQIVIIKRDNYSEEPGDSILDLKDQLNAKENCPIYHNMQQNRGSEDYTRDANLRTICI